MCFLCNSGNIQQTIYCERGYSTAFFSEPINAFTNFLFIILGIRAYSLIKIKNVTDKELLILPYLLSIIGIGSFLYHTARNSTTLLLDAVPIYIFIAYTLFLAFVALTKKRVLSLAIVAFFIVMQVAISIYVPREFMNGSIRHIITILFISAVGWFLNERFGKTVLHKLAWVIGFYALAISFRSVDSMVCQYIPLGTHFLWHIFAALAGYKTILLITAIKTIRQ
jgi:hypothetical protein